MVRGIKFLSYADRSGYGTAGAAYIFGLVNAGLPLTWVPLIFDRYGYVPWSSGKGRLPFLEGEDSENGADRVDACLLGAVERPLAYDTVLMHTQPEYWPGYWEAGKRRIGYTVWETDHIPRHWVPLLNTAVQILVPCRFNAEVFRHDGVKCPISIVPHLYRPPAEVTPEEVADFRARLGIRNDQFVFYTINAWTARKALWETVTAFMDAFTASDPVILIIKTSATGVRDEDSETFLPTPQIVAELCAGRRHLPEIRLLCRHMTMREMNLLHRIGNCYVSLTHSEGWGLGAFDAAGIGNPVVITGWGGHLEYLPRGSAALVDYRLVPVRDRQGAQSYGSRQHWAQAERGHAVELLREVLRDPPTARARGVLTRRYIRETFSEASVISRLINAINEPDTP